MCRTGGHHEANGILPSVAFVRKCGAMTKCMSLYADTCARFMRASTVPCRARHDMSCPISEERTGVSIRHVQPFPDAVKVAYEESVFVRASAFAAFGCDPTGRNKFPVAVPTAASHMHAGTLARSRYAGVMAPSGDAHVLVLYTLSDGSNAAACVDEHGNVWRVHALAPSVCFEGVTVMHVVWDLWCMEVTDDAREQAWSNPWCVAVDTPRACGRSMYDLPYDVRHAVLSEVLYTGGESRIQIVVGPLRVQIATASFSVAPQEVIAVGCTREIYAGATFPTNGFEYMLWPLAGPIASADQLFDGRVLRIRYPGATFCVRLACYAVRKPQRRRPTGTCMLRVLYLTETGTEVDGGIRDKFQFVTRQTHFVLSKCRSSVCVMNYMGASDPQSAIVECMAVDTSDGIELLPVRVRRDRDTPDKYGCIIQALTASPITPAPAPPGDGSNN